MELTDFEPLLVDFYSMSPIHMVSPRKLLFEVFFFLHACFQYDIEKEKERLCMNSMIFIVRVTQFYSQCIVIVKKNQIRFSVPCHISHTKGVDNSTQITLLTSETQFVLLILTPAQYNKGCYKEQSRPNRISLFPFSVNMLLQFPRFHHRSHDFDLFDFYSVNG